MKTTMDRAGRVVIPKEIRQRAGLEAGAELDIRLDNGIVEILQPRPRGRLVEDAGHLFWESAPGVEISTEEINQAIEDVRNERDDEITNGALGREDRSGL